MKNTIYICTLSTILVTACGSGSEKSTSFEKKKADSIDAIAEQAGREMSALGKQLKQDSLKNRLIDLRAKLAGNESKLADAQQSGQYTTDEKAKKIEELTRTVETFKKEIFDTERLIEE